MDFVTGNKLIVAIREMAAVTNRLTKAPLNRDLLIEFKRTCETAAALVDAFLA